MHWTLFSLPYLEDGLKGCIYIIGMYSVTSFAKKTVEFDITLQFYQQKFDLKPRYGVKSGELHGA